MCNDKVDTYKWGFDDEYIAMHLINVIKRNIHSVIG